MLQEPTASTASPLLLPIDADESASSPRCDQQRDTLDRPECSEGANRITGKRLHPPWPAGFQHAEATFHSQPPQDQTELPQLDTDVEGKQGKRQVLGLSLMNIKMCIRARHGVNSR